LAELDKELALQAAQSPQAPLIGLGRHSAASRLLPHSSSSQNWAICVGSRRPGTWWVMGYTGASSLADIPALSRYRRGGITKTGNAYVWHILVEAAWHPVCSCAPARPHITPAQLRWEGLYAATNGLDGPSISGFVLLAIVLRHGSLSVLYPILAVSYVWVALLSVLFLGEPFSATQWIGMGLIVGGIGLIARKAW